MKNLDNIVNKIEKNIDDKELIREKSLRYSRDIIINCRKAIQCVHQGLNDKADENIKKASDKLAELYDTTKPFPEIFHAGFVENAAQELVEASCFYNIMLGKDLPDPDELQTTYSSYLMGLCDLVGELRRTVLDSIRSGKQRNADEYLTMMEEIYDVIIRFDYPSGLVPIKKKQDMVRGLIEKTRGELAVASCERRIEHRTYEFKGILDQINENDNKTKSKKKKDQDLDLDKIW